MVLRLGPIGRRLPRILQRAFTSTNLERVNILYCCVPGNMVTAFVCACEGMYAWMDGDVHMHIQVDRGTDRQFFASNV